MCAKTIDSVVVLGATATGKTTLAVCLARAFHGEIVSADSRQVYRGLDVGSGKDLDEFGAGADRVSYHLIDIVDLDAEFNLYDYQQTCYPTIDELRSRAVLPVIVGGTGMYLEAIIRGYALAEAPENPALRESLGEKSDRELVERLVKLRPEQHNRTDLEDRDRLLRAIEIAEAQNAASADAEPRIHPLVLGIRWDRPVLRKRIDERLRARLGAGLVEEVEGLLAKGVTAERLRALGLEYRFVTDFLEGRIKNRNDLYQKLRVAIHQFAKRQETWYRRMERRGTAIEWLDGCDLDRATTLVSVALGRS